MTEKNQRSDKITRKNVLFAIRVIRFPVKFVRRNLRLAYYWAAGKYVEWQGNTAVIDGYRFSLEGMSLPAPQKGFRVLTYEFHERAMIKQYLDERLPVIEFGGGAGVVSCLTNKRLLQPQRHVVVEADPDQIPIIETNRQNLDCQFEILQAALGYGDDTILFYRTPLQGSSSTIPQEGEAIEVPTITLGSLIDQYGFHPITVICDVEGTEVDLVQEEIDVLAQHVKMLIVEFHPHIVGHETVDAALQVLESAGFRSLHTTSPNIQGVYVAAFENNHID